MADDWNADNLSYTIHYTKKEVAYRLEIYMINSNCLYVEFKVGIE
jgi:hypothetical protein